MLTFIKSKSRVVLQIILKSVRSCEATVSNKLHQIATFETGQIAKTTINQIHARLSKKKPERDPKWRDVLKLDLLFGWPFTTSRFTTCFVFRIRILYPNLSPPNLDDTSAYSYTFKDVGCTIFGEKSFDIQIMERIRPKLMFIHNSIFYYNFICFVIWMLLKYSLLLCYINQVNIDNQGL